MGRIATVVILLLLFTAWPLLAGPADCLYEIQAEGEAGRTVLRTVGYALHRAGLLAAPLHDLQQGGRRWSSLRLVSTVRRPDHQTLRASFTIDAVALIDAERNLAVLRSAALPPCGAGVGDLPAKGAAVTGLRHSRGYESPLFETTLERPVILPSGVAVMRFEIADGSGAPAGFLLDDGGRLVGTILPRAAGADRFRAAAVDLPPDLIAAAQAVPGRPPETILSAGVVPVRDTTSMLLATALVVDRRESPETVLACLAAVEERTGEFPGLLLQRGAVEFDRGNLPGAIADFKAAVAAAPDEHLAYYNLGVSLGADGRYNAAAEAFRTALRLVPDDPRTLYNLAVALAAANRHDEAVVLYTDLSRVDPALAADLKALIGR